MALLLIGVAVGFCAPQMATAKSAKDIYAEADRKYAYLIKNPKLQKYRDKWFACIDRFKDVYKEDPDGPWAAAGMYKTGELYWELYKRSYKASDKAEALDTFQRVLKRYPTSRYNKKARDFIASIDGRGQAAAEKGYPQPGKTSERC